MKKIIRFWLKNLAQKFIKKYRPRVIGITGSIGKSSSKEMTYAILKDHFEVRRTIKNYNNELGVPLTILGRLSPGKSLAGWLRVLWMAWGGLIFREISYPKILVLEMGVDRLGDMKYLHTIVRPEIGVITAIAPAHLEFFGSIENIVREKQLLITSLPSSGWAVLNADDDLVWGMKDHVKVKIISFGFSERADVRVMEYELDQQIEDNTTKINGIRMKIQYHGSVVPIFLPKIISRSQVYAVLAAISVGIVFDLNLIEISESCGKCEAVKGRMNLVAGINQSLIIDDTYNASPTATEAALSNLLEIEKASQARRIVVLGDMLELGRNSVEYHQNVGESEFINDIDLLITIGELAKDIAEGAKKDKENLKKTLSFEQQSEAIEFLKNNIKKGDIILVKGSQGARMEKVVQAIMAEPQRAKNLLVRQDSMWGDKI